MIWQDVVFLWGNIVFVVSLAWAILGRGTRFPRGASALTAAVLACYYVAFASQGAWIPAWSTLATSAAWTLIAILRPIDPSPWRPGTCYCCGKPIHVGDAVRQVRRQSDFCFFIVHGDCFPSDCRDVTERAA